MDHEQIVREYLDIPYRTDHIYLEKDELICPYCNEIVKYKDINEHSKMITKCCICNSTFYKYNGCRHSNSKKHKKNVHKYILSIH